MTNNFVNANAAIQAARLRMNQRMVDSVAAKLGVPLRVVRIVRFDEHKTGAEIPVFSVPADKREQAIALGLTVEQ